MSLAVTSPRDNHSILQFNIKEVHFKMPSEHTVKGLIYPLEMQFMGEPDFRKSLIRTHHFSQGMAFRKVILSQLVRNGNGT